MATTESGFRWIGNNKGTFREASSLQLGSGIDAKVILRG